MNDTKATADRGPRKAILIDATAQTVTEVEVSELPEMEKLVADYDDIRIAYEWPNGDVLYVDREALLKDPTRFFMILQNPDEIFGGNGLVVGPNDVNSNKWMVSPTMTADRLRPDILFLEPTGGLVWTDPQLRLHNRTQPRPDRR